MDEVGSGTFEIEPVDVPWDATTMTWNNKPLGIENYKITVPLTVRRSESCIEKE